MIFYEKTDSSKTILQFAQKNSIIKKTVAHKVYKNWKITDSKYRKIMKETDNYGKKSGRDSAADQQSSVRVWNRMFFKECI